jgi:hypothetical protein
MTVWARSPTEDGHNSFFSVWSCLPWSTLKSLRRKRGIRLSVVQWHRGVALAWSRRVPARSGGWGIRLVQCQGPTTNDPDITPALWTSTHSTFSEEPILTCDGEPSYACDVTPGRCPNCNSVRAPIRPNQSTCPPRGNLHCPDSTPNCFRLQFALLVQAPRAKCRANPAHGLSEFHERLPIPALSSRFMARH